VTNFPIFAASVDKPEHYPIVQKFWEFGVSWICGVVRICGTDLYEGENAGRICNK